ncbi:Regulating synaptic membrane exocytosis protein 1 [Dissostichus eleginoides]|uniref:Regulating synaptic membrane exocytosis protein 1 n=1 Tax=Dissostichus eleginoides TaxID=100907 RepID=A0AAD9BN18_DISEL|nr:Regulating synaptic membrane exocytosis protein 1 [Dissostichus eleginoides]
MVDERFLFDFFHHQNQLTTDQVLCFPTVFYPATKEDMSAFNGSRTLHQQFESYKQEVRRIGGDTRRQPPQLKDDAPTCGICRKTKFADGCGHLCSYCQTKFCARCGGRVSLRSNNFPLGVEEP